MNSAPSSHFMTSLNARIVPLGRPAEPRRAAIEFVTVRPQSDPRSGAVPLGSRHLLKIKQRRRGRGNRRLGRGRREEARLGFVHGSVLLQAMDEPPIIRRPPPDLRAQPPRFFTGIRAETA